MRLINKSVRVEEMRTQMVQAAIAACRYSAEDGCGGLQDDGAKLGPHSAFPQRQAQTTQGLDGERHVRSRLCANLQVIFVMIVAKNVYGTRRGLIVVDGHASRDPCPCPHTRPHNCRALRECNERWLRFNSHFHKISFRQDALNASRSGLFSFKNIYLHNLMFELRKIMCDASLIFEQQRNEVSNHQYIIWYKYAQFARSVIFFVN